MRNQHGFKHFGLLKPLKTWSYVATFMVPLVMIACGQGGQMDIQQFKAASAQAEQTAQAKLDNYNARLQQADSGNSAEDQDYANALQEQKLAQSSAAQSPNGKTEIVNDGDDGGGDTTAAALAALIPSSVKSTVRDVVAAADDFLKNLAPPEPQFALPKDSSASDKPAKVVQPPVVTAPPTQTQQQATVTQTGAQTSTQKTAPTPTTPNSSGASSDTISTADATTATQKPKGIISSVFDMVTGLFKSKPKEKPKIAVPDDTNAQVISANTTASATTAPVTPVPPTTNTTTATATAAAASAATVPEALSPVVPAETPESLEQLDYKNPKCASTNVSCLSPYGRRIKQAYGFYGTIIGKPDHNIGGRLHDAAELDANGQGYHQKADSRQSRFGTDQLVAFVQGLAKDVLAKNLTHELMIGDLSRQGGGYSGHQGHQNGLDVDISFIHTNSVPDHFQNDVVNGVITSNFALEQNWQMVQDAVRTHWIYEIFVHKAVKDAFCNLAKKSANPSDYDEVLSAIAPEPSHTNHFHMRLKCPISSPCNPEPNRSTATGCGK